jgi:hypothetical protein
VVVVPAEAANSETACNSSILRTTEVGIYCPEDVSGRLVVGTGEIRRTKGDGELNLRPTTATRSAKDGLPYAHPYGVGMTPETCEESVLSSPVESTAVTT